MDIKFKPEFASKLIRCPSLPSQDGQCVGLLNVWAYLRLTGYYLGTAIGPQGQPAPNVVNIDQQVLPVKATIEFSLHEDKKKCIVSPCGLCRVSPKGSAPITYYDTLPNTVNVSKRFDREGQGGTAKCEQDGDCLRATINFTWVESSIPISAGGSVQADVNASGDVTITGTGGPGVPVAGINVKGQGKASAGVSGGATVAIGGVRIPLEVVVRICCSDRTCRPVVDPSPDTGPDAQQVYDNAT